MTMPTASVLTACSLALLCIAALHDVLARTIPNWMSAALAASAVPLLWPLPAAADRLLAAALLFGGAALCWRLGWLGGGDVKLLGAVGLLVPPGRAADTVLMITLAGAVLAVPYLACRGRIARPAPVRPTTLLARAWRAERFRMRRGGPLPYGVAIAVGSAFGLLGGPS